MGWSADRRWQRAWAAGCGALVVAFVGLDLYVRDGGWNSPLAREHVDLWVSIALGCGCGLIGLAALWFMPRSQRKFYADFFRLSYRERWHWQHQKWNLLYSGWSLVLVYGLLGWCLIHWVFPAPALLAANAVMFVAIPPWAWPAAPERSSGGPEPAVDTGDSAR
jgi:hypothetical protein